MKRPARLQRAKIPQSIPAPGAERERARPRSDSEERERARPRSDSEERERARIAELSARVAELEAENRRLEAQLASAQPGSVSSVDPELRFRAIFEAEPACVKLVGADGELLSMNPAGLAMIEADDEAQVLGLCVYELVCPHDRAAFVELNRRVFAGRSASLEFEITGLRGTPRHMETFAAPLVNEQGEVVAQLAVTHDITARKRERAELDAHRDHLETLVAERTRELEASREDARRVERLASLGTLAAGLAHELNNPLGTILLGTEMIRIAEGPAEREAAVLGIQRDVARCHHIVKSMLAFGRGQASDKLPLSINQVVHTARDHARDVLEKSRVAVDLELDGSLPLVSGNTTELGQVLINLIQNAALASPPGARLRIRTRRDGAQVVCEVEDEGCGMDAETRARARDPFYTTRLAEGGTGLGLSVSHGILSDHRADLEIESEPGAGTLVRFSLPIGSARSAGTAQRPADET